MLKQSRGEGREGIMCTLRRRAAAGFTLIEVMIAVVIISLIMGAISMVILSNAAPPCALEARRSSTCAASSVWSGRSPPRARCVRCGAE